MCILPAIESLVSFSLSRKIDRYISRIKKRANPHRGIAPILSQFLLELFSNNSSSFYSSISSSRVNSGRINCFNSNFFYNSNAINSFSRLSGFITTRSERHCKSNSEEQN